MTGLDLESFLLLLRADLAAWAVIGLMGLVLAGLVWLSWGSRRALRKCLVASLVAHTGLAYYARSVPAIGQALGGGRPEDPSRSHIRKIQVLPVSEDRRDGGGTGAPSRSRSSAAPTRPLDRTIEPLATAESSVATRSRPRTDADDTAKPPELPELASPEPIPLATAVPTPRDPQPPPTFPIEAPRETAIGVEAGAGSVPKPLAPTLSEADRDEVPGAVPLREPADAVGPGPTPGTIGESLASIPDRPLRGGSRPRRDPNPRPTGPALPDLAIEVDRPPVPLARAVPAGSGSGGSGPAGAIGGGSEEGLADLLGPIGSRPIQEVPPVYRPRLDPNRSAAAKLAGASDGSEQAVERALDWLARHQDDDGRWDGGTARDVEGNTVDDDDDFTVHCPPGQVCFGECIYWEADTALTGLALLTFLGSGYTQSEGKYSVAIEKGIQYLIRTQKTNGDLRGQSRAVGMYCHAMAALALCEAYALTGDARLLDPATRAVEFAVSSRARDRQAWRYAPGAVIGDTSILGWVVMLIKSARESRIAVPNSIDVQRGILKWLGRVAGGERKGLARYQPTEPVTPTMTAEAWVCRQFLGEGGPGSASEEAARHLLRNPTDRGKTNLYYWYYATLAMYQHGGEHWTRWNRRTRDAIVELQRTSGHQAGSWDPDDSIYGLNGGRIYCTAMAALTLEVYYRYLRLYDQPSLPIEAAPSSP
jgi:hypothetical protein